MKELRRAASILLVIHFAYSQLCMQKMLGIGKLYGRYKCRRKQILNAGYITKYAHWWKLYLSGFFLFFSLLTSELFFSACRILIMTKTRSSLTHGDVCHDTKQTKVCQVLQNSMSCFLRKTEFIGFCIQATYSKICKELHGKQNSF